MALPGKPSPAATQQPLPLAVVRVGHLAPPPPPPPPPPPAATAAAPIVQRTPAPPRAPPPHSGQRRQHLRQQHGSASHGTGTGGNMVKRTATPPLTASAHSMHRSKSVSHLNAHVSAHVSPQSAAATVLPVQRSVQLPTVHHRTPQPRAHPKPRVLIQHAPNHGYVNTTVHVMSRRSSINSRTNHSTSAMQQRRSTIMPTRRHSHVHVQSMHRTLTPPQTLSTLTAPRTRTRVHRDFSTARVPSSSAVTTNGHVPGPPAYSAPFVQVTAAPSATYRPQVTGVHATSTNSIMSNFTVAQHSMSAPPPPPPPPHPHNMNFVEIPTPPSFSAQALPMATPPIRSATSSMNSISTSAGMTSSVSSLGRSGTQSYGLRKRRLHLASGAQRCRDYVPGHFSLIPAQSNIMMFSWQLHIVC